MRSSFLAIAALAVAWPVAAQTPPPAADLARCEQLFSQYERYSNTGGESRSGSSFGSFEARKALEDCRRGNTADGIAVLERKLRALGFRI
jgi:hypothetical protein